MPSLIPNERATQVAREVAVIHQMAAIDAFRGLTQLKEADQNQANAMIAATRSRRSEPTSPPPPPTVPPDAALSEPTTR